MSDPRDVAMLRAAMDAVPTTVCYSKIPAAILDQGFRLVPITDWQRSVGHRVRSGVPHDCLALDCAKVGDDYWDLIERMAEGS